MKRHRGRVIDVDSVDELDRRLAAGAPDLRGWRLRGLDLIGRGPELRRIPVDGAVFVDCDLTADDAAALASAGAVVDVGGTPPLDIARSHLYSAAELYDTPRYADSFDARAYAWSQRHRNADDTRVAALHDHGIDRALETWIRDRRVVGVMGGHAVERGSADFAAAARFGHRLGTGFVVATGGGPGAMEAANLGGALAGRPVAVLDGALAQLAQVASFRPDVDAWLAPALDVVHGVLPHDSLGVPTWHYGHEPANVFATAIAKYVRNATREAVLLQVCNAGIVFLPGAGGTVQEIFQDACENYYADPSSVAPMVLVGRTHWTETLPAWPLLQTLARGRAMEGHVHLVDTVDDALALLSGTPR